MENEHWAEDNHSMGEDSGIPMELSVAGQANAKAEDTTSENTIIDLGESGKHKFKNTRYGYPTKEGFVTAYTVSREWVANHEEVIWIPIALVTVGAVIGGVMKLRHDHKK